MPNTNATTALGHIPERRRRLHAGRTFERRSSGGVDARVIRHFEELGVGKVQAILSRGGFGNRSAVAKQWLEHQEPVRTDGALKLVLAVALMAIGGAMVYFALGS